MSEKRRNAATCRELNKNEILELAYGPGSESSYFENDSLRRRAYYLNREEIMGFVRAGRRPWGWWRYEANEKRKITGSRPVTKPFSNRPARVVGCHCGEEHFGYIHERESEQDYLRRLGLLGPEEIAILQVTEGLKT